MIMDFLNYLIMMKFQFCFLLTEMKDSTTPEWSRKWLGIFISLKPLTNEPDIKSGVNVLAIFLAQSLPTQIIFISNDYPFKYIFFQTDLFWYSTLFDISFRCTA